MLWESIEKSYATVPLDSLYHGSFAVTQIGSKTFTCILEKLLSIKLTYSKLQIQLSNNYSS